MEIEFTIRTHAIDDRPSSLGGILSNKIIEGSLFNCRYTLNSKNENLTISGENETEIVKCARHILRVISKNQGWGFYYDSRIFKITKPHKNAEKTTSSISLTSDSRFIKEYETTIDIQFKTSLATAHNVLVEDITKEYELPYFLDFLFQEAIFNKSIKKYRVAYLLAFSALESSIKLVCEYHCGVKNKPLTKLLEKLVKDKDIKLRVDKNSFEEFRKLRNDIAHGDIQFQKLDTETKKEIVNGLFQDLDEIFDQLSIYLIKFEKHLKL